MIEFMKGNPYTKKMQVPSPYMSNSSGPIKVDRSKRANASMAGTSSSTVSTAALSHHPARTLKVVRQVEPTENANANDKVKTEVASPLIKRVSASLNPVSGRNSVMQRTQDHAPANPIQVNEKQRAH